MHRFLTSAMILLTAASLTVAACTSDLIGEGPRNTPIENFDAFWLEFDRLYAFFDVKQVDWDAVGRHYRSRVHSALGDPELASLFDEMITLLNDGHVFLQTDDSVYYSAKAQRLEPSTFDAEIVRSYLDGTDQIVGEGKILFGRVGSDIGYIRVSSWTDKGGLLSAIGEWVKDFDVGLDALWNVDGLILDVRGNSGGSYFNGRYVAGRFTDVARVATHSHFRSGPAHSDFSEIETWRVEPRGTMFRMPVALLIDGRTASASEWFTLAMREMPQVTLIGATTAGAMGTRIRRELPNGWMYGLPVQRLYSSEMELLEEQGIAPDIVVAPDSSASDPVIERALIFLRSVHDPAIP